MTAFIRTATAILALTVSVGLAAAQVDNKTGTGGANTQNAIGNDFAKSPDSNPSPAEPIPGATGQTTPAKFSAENAAKDEIPLAVNNLNLSEADKQAILQAVSQDRAPASTTGSGSGSAVTPPEPGSLLSDFFEMRDFPGPLTDQMPALRNHKYVAMPDRVLLVNPANRIVISEIKK